jgi:hypothetical protein
MITEDTEVVPQEIRRPRDPELKYLLRESEVEARRGTIDLDHKAHIKMTVLLTLRKKGRVTLSEMLVRFRDHKQEVRAVFRVVSNLIHHGKDVDPEDRKS